MAARVWSNEKTIGVAIFVIAVCALLLRFFLTIASSGRPFGSNGPASDWRVSTAGDIDGDSTPDLLIQTPFEPVSRRRYGSTRVISGKSRACLLMLANEGSSYVCDSVARAAGDVNGDGRADLVRECGGRRVVFDVASEREFFSLENEGYEMCVPVGDVDGDGGGDLLLRGHPRAPRPSGFWSRPPWAYFVSLMSGKTGRLLWSLEGREVEREGEFRSFGNHGCACGDVDGDGVVDLAIDTETERVRVLSGRDGSTLKEFDIACADYGGAIATAGDLDGDGFDELLVRPGHWQQVDVVSVRSGEVLYRTPGGHFRDAFPVGDQNGDGVIDIVTSRFPTCLYSGADGALLERFADDRSVEGAVDIDADGVRDLLVACNVWGAQAKAMGDDVWRAGRVEVLSGRDRSILFSIDGDDLTPIADR